MEQHVVFDTCADFEFGLNGVRQTDYFIYNADYKDGLVVYIPGFGGDLGEYAKAFCEKTAKQYQMAALTLNYFCIGSRPSAGAKVEVHNTEKAKVEQAFIQMGGTGEASIEALNALLMNSNNHIKLTGDLVPTKNEYQNFGLLAALDIINAIKDAAQRFNLSLDNVILVGSSYGGYLANLVTKLYPGLIKAVFDNSSWAQTNLAYVVGQEMGVPEFSYQVYPKVILDLNVRSPWTLTQGLPNTFGGGRKEIRGFSRSQLQSMVEQGGQDTFYVFYHAATDTIAPTQEKIDMANNMAELGFKHVLMNVVDESDVDGHFIKNLGHGMGMSMRKFFEVGYGFLQEINPDFKFNDQLKQAVFETSDLIYQFDLSADVVTGQVTTKNKFS
ncbi:DUF2920 family protein [Thiomicrospira sp.]|uniref:DUF2920 family protein n=1 Tax=Thiomicrospira sp. TaxID=935 RepID=UPI002F9241C9